MIKVCDAIMGSGKTSAAINYMNEHPDQKFIFITPYLEEASRIKTSCPQLNFVEPSDKNPNFNFRKSEHTAYLIKQGHNIATTHQAFKNYTDEMLTDISQNEYILIIDENVDVLDKFNFNVFDLKFAVEAGYVRNDNGSYSITDKEYMGEALKGLFEQLRLKGLEQISNSTESITTGFYWVLTPTLLTAFKDVYILTYLFEGQSLCYLLRIYNIPYSYIGVKIAETGEHLFGEYREYVPTYTYSLRDKIHIVDNKALNLIGQNARALSLTWFQKRQGEVAVLKNNIYNVINNIWRGVPAKQKLWGSFKSKQRNLSGDGYSRSFLVFNTKATNTYRKRTHLVYAINVFMNVGDKEFYRSHGIIANEKLYALSIMVQWIWRSAIREGNDIYLYIPSSRMRGMLTEWMDKLAEGGDMVEREAM